MVPADGEDFSLRNPSDEIPYQRHDPQMDIRDEHKSSSLVEEVKKHTGKGEETKTQNTNGQMQTEKPYCSFVRVRNTQTQMETRQ